MIRRVLLLCLLPVTIAAADDPVPVHPDRAQLQEELLDLEEAPRQVRRAVGKALIQQNKGDVEGARATLSRLTEPPASHDHHLVRYYLGGLLARQDSLALALPEFEVAVALEPRFQPGWRILGEVAYGEGDYARAAEAFARAAELDPWDDPELVYYRGVALLQAEDDAAATTLLVDLMAAHPDAPLGWYRALVSAAAGAGQAERASAAMAVLTSSRPDEAEAWDLAYEQAAAALDYERAAAMLTIRGHLEPLDQRELIQLGDLLMAVGAPARAARVYEEALAGASAPDPRELDRLVNAHLGAHDRPAALAAMDRRLTVEPDAQVWQLKGEILFGQGEYAAALEAFDQAAGLDPNDRGLDLLRGYCSLELENTVAARGHFAEAARDARYAERAQEALRHLRGNATP